MSQMSTITEVNPRLAALSKAGVSVWLDQIRRSLVESGELARMITEDCLRGMTANPSIFEKAILGSTDYDRDLERLARERMDAVAIYEHLVVRDVQVAADVLAGVHAESGGRDGFVSLEVSPALAHDTEGTLAEVRSYWQRLDRPNVMIKIPGTPEGTPAIEQALYEGINVNVTLLFSVSAYEDVAEAYIRALGRRLADGLPLTVSSVASFFVSRVDTAVDRRLAELGHPELRGRAAIANARLAYRRFKQIFNGPRWAALGEAGAAVQRPLWASTSTKDPRYPDTMYVEELVGAHTVNTMPPQTLLAVADHGETRGPTAERDPAPDLAALSRAGIDMDRVTDELLVDGIAQFTDALGRLLEGIEQRRAAAITGRPPTIRAKLPSDVQAPVAERVRRALAEDVARRVWSRDATLWGGTRIPPTPEIANRLGWLTVSETMLEHAAELHAFAQTCREDGFTDAVLLGMGGSSLGPEVIRRSFGEIPGALRLQVLDSTHPDVVLRTRESVDLRRTLFVVSSKSGTAIETLAHYRHFQELADPEQFIAITDPGTPLATLAADTGFRRLFLDPPGIGERYSVLSYAGLVPAALMGVEIEALLRRGQVAEQNCAHHDSSESNSGLWLGATLGELARSGRDKLTLIVSPPIESVGPWVEQLLAGSTGKRGRGIVPIVDEPLAAPEAYGDDRVIVYLRNAEEPNEDLDETVARLADAGRPTLTLNTHGPADLGRIFFLAQFATAVAGWVLELNPFDEPNVHEATDNTIRLLQAAAVPHLEPAGDDRLRTLLTRAAAPQYVALTAWLAQSERLDEALTELRAVIHSSTGAATTLGYGPRYLHSTGQLHKGGPPTGRFLQLIDEPQRDARVPAAGYSFRTLVAAQAAGDLLALRAHGLPAERIALEGEPVAAVRALTERISGLLQGREVRP